MADMIYYLCALYYEVGIYFLGEGGAEQFLEGR